MRYNTTTLKHSNTFYAKYQRNIMNRYNSEIHKLYAKMIAMLLIMLSGAAFAQNLQLTASVDRNPVSENETFTYEIKISGTSSSLPDVTMPALSDFRILSGPNQSSQFSMVNGSVSVSKTYSVTLLANKTGKFTIPAVQVKHKGNIYRTNPIQITVTKSNNSGNQGAQPGSGNQNSSASAGSDNVFIRVAPSKNTVYVNDQINIAYKVYFRVPIRNPDFLKLPETVGFWVEEYKIPQNIPVKQEVINGVQYSVAEVKKFAVFPTKPGELTISPLQLSVDVVQRRRRRDPFSAFDDFFNDPLGRTVRKVLTSRALKINVQPLPESGKPANFSGLVGDFNMTTTIDNTDVKANEAITYKIKLSGSGNLKILNKLSINFPSTFEVFNPKINDNINRSSDRLNFTRELEYVVIPRSPGEYRIEPLALSFFDPKSRQYRKLHSRAYVVHVAEGDEIAGVGSGNFSKSEVKLLGQDINFIKEDQLNLSPIDYKPYQSGWFWASLVLPLAFLGLAIGYRNHSEKMSTNVEYARKRKAVRQAEKRLREAKTHLQKQNFGEFYGEVSKALLGFVADKTNQSAAGLLRENVEQLLKENDVEQEMISEYLACLDEADFRRFAPGQTAATDAKQFYDRAAELLSNFGKYFK